ncbi:hypothetical protein ONZ45_g12926 [Pleurotus djamor]|nr:hypothetical protein ONZ45_g12926 [Pleurotus djamor]
MGLRVQLGHQGGKCPVPDAAPKVFTVLHVNGLHTVNVDFCNCHCRISRPYQLLRERWFPATVKLPATCATFELLRHFHGLSLCSKISAYEYYLNLERLTDNSRIDIPKTRYRAFLRMVRQFRHLRMLKRAGRGHIKDGIEKAGEGDLALDCAACPMEGINLPRDWARATPLALMHVFAMFVIDDIWTDRESRFLYTVFLSIDANFRLKNRLRNVENADPGLHTGLAYFVPSQPYNNHIMKHATEADISTCSSFEAISRADSKMTTGLRFTGVGMCVCSRHEMIRRSGVGDLQKGERIMVIYDIACQWKVNFLSRMSALPTKLHIPPSTSLSFAIPKCHAPAHQASCQAPHSLNLMPGAGRTDGEGIERDWSMLNAAANSTREMGLGSRHDTLDDLFAYHNWQKTTGLGISLRRKYLLASVESRRHTLLHKEFTESIPRDVQVAWTRMITEWEGDKSKSNPYEVEVEFETEADVKRKLLALECKDDPAGGSAREGMSLLLEDTGLAGGMAHSPMLDGYASLNAMPFNPWLMFWALMDTIKSKLGLSPIFVQAVGTPNEYAALNTPSFVAMFAQGKIPFTEAPNLINPRVCFEIMGTRPGVNLKIAHAPMLVIATKDDDMIPFAVAKSVAEAAPDIVTLVEAPGGHFDIMKGGQSYELNITAQIRFLKALL